jgi:hypothetical protein
MDQQHEDTRMAALHESAHITAAKTLGCDVLSAELFPRPQGGCEGLTVYRKAIASIPPGADDEIALGAVLADMVIAAAGSSVHDLAYSHKGRPHASSFYVDDKELWKLGRLAADSIDDCIQGVADVRSYATKLVMSHWHTVRRLAKALQQQGRLDREQIDQILIQEDE